MEAVMGRRSDFERRPQDAYETPWDAVLPLAPWLPRGARCFEPCCGKGMFVGHLKRLGYEVTGASDLPIYARSHRYDAAGTNFFVTNPPWSGKALHEIIANLSDQLPTWLLVDYNWAATLQAVPFLPRMRKLVVIGRVRWIPDSPFTGKDDACWIQFTKPSSVPSIFIGRRPLVAPALPLAAEGIRMPPDLVKVDVGGAAHALGSTSRGLDRE
jgi:hypothetical protein